MPSYKATYKVYRDDKVTTENRIYQANNLSDAERQGKDMVVFLERNLEARVEYQSVGLNVKKR